MSYKTVRLNTQERGQEKIFAVILRLQPSKYEVLEAQQFTKAQLHQELRKPNREIWALVRD